MRADMFVAVFGLACVALGLTAGRAWPTARAVERWLDDAEAEAERMGTEVRDLRREADDPDAGAESPADFLAVGSPDLPGTELSGLAIGEPRCDFCPTSPPCAGCDRAVRLPSAVERAAMYDTLTNDPPGPDPASAASLRAGGHQRTGRGRADRRDWHKHRGPYAPGQERHVTLAQAEHEAAELRHQWHDDAMRREFREWEAEMGELIGSARAWLATL